MGQLLKRWGSRCTLAQEAFITGANSPKEWMPMNSTGDFLSAVLLFSVAVTVTWQGRTRRTRLMQHHISAFFGFPSVLCHLRALILMLLSCLRCLNSTSAMSKYKGLRVDYERVTLYQSQDDIMEEVSANRQQFNQHLHFDFRSHFFFYQLLVYMNTMQALFPYTIYYIYICI